jgi:hypothetical protein
MRDQKGKSSASMMHSDSSAANSGGIGRANGWGHSKGDFGAFVRLSAQKQGDA